MEEYSKLLELVIRKAWDDHRDIHEKWIQVSHQKFGMKENPWLAFQLQQVARTDLFLRTYQPPPSYDNTGDVHTSFDFIISLSGLWLISLFEILRTANKPEYTDFKKKLSFIRAPMVKHQISGRKEMSIAAPTRNEAGKFGWSIIRPDTGSQEIFVRDELSDEFLAI